MWLWLNWTWNSKRLRTEFLLKLPDAFYLFPRNLGNFHIRIREVHGAVRSIDLHYDAVNVAWSRLGNKGRSWTTLWRSKAHSSFNNTDHWKAMKYKIILNDRGKRMKEEEPWLVWFYGILPIVGYLMPNPFYTYKQFYFQKFNLA